MQDAPSPPDREGYEEASPPARVYGVDVSVAAADAGERTWVAALDASEESGADAAPTVTACAPAREFLGCAPDRAATTDALVSFVRGLDGDAAVGFDFPFGVPEPLLDRAGLADWRTFIEWFPDGMADPDDFSGWGIDHARAHTDGERTYLGRRTDTETGGKSPYGFIAKYPAFYGLRDVLKPLVEAGDATVVPVTAHEPGRPFVLETYPAAVLDDRGLGREGYKGGGEAEREARRANLEGLAGEFRAVPEPVRERVLADAGGDGLDALAAAASAHANTRDPAALPTDEPAYLREARIYS